MNFTVQLVFSCLDFDSLLANEEGSKAREYLNKILGEGAKSQKRVLVFDGAAVHFPLKGCTLR